MRRFLADKVGGIPFNAVFLYQSSENGYRLTTTAKATMAKRGLLTLGKAATVAGPDCYTVVPNFLEFGATSLFDPITLTLSVSEARLRQGQFRSFLMQYWDGACAFTGCTVRQALTASHMLTANWKERLSPMVMGW